MNIDDVIKNILSDFMKVDNNVYHGEKLFIAHTVLQWAFKNSSNKEQLNFYILQVRRYLRGELTIFWKDGKIRIINRGKNGD